MTESSLLLLVNTQASSELNFQAIMSHLFMHHMIREHARFFYIWTYHLHASPLLPVLSFLISHGYMNSQYLYS